MFCTYTASQHITLCNPHIEVISQAKGAAKSLFKILERKSKINALDDSGTKPEGFKGNIVFDNLYFNYPSRPDVKVSYNRRDLPLNIITYNILPATSRSRNV